MESIEQKDMNKKDHICTPGHCCECNGCGGMCMRGGMGHSMKRYWVRHFIVLILGVVAAFCVGMKLGEMKGFIMASYGGRGYDRGFMMDRDQGRYQYMGTQSAPAIPATPSAQ